MSPLALIAGSANPHLVTAVAAAAGTPLTTCAIQSFPDGERHVELHQTVRGSDVYVLQPTSPPVADHLLELLLIGDAARRAGAARLTAVMPYFGYARQDRRVGGREAIGARLVADLVGGGFARVVAVDLHTPAIEAFFHGPVEHLSAGSLLAGALGPVRDDAIVVAPDLGAVRLADQLAQRIERPVATVHKVRLGPEAVRVREVVGRVQGRAPIIVDDMISTGGTVAAAVRALLAAGCAPDVTVVVTHGLLVGDVARVLGDLPIGRLITTDSVPAQPGVPLPVKVVSLAPLLADVIVRLNREASLSELMPHR